jgi:hypothetical protein
LKKDLKNSKTLHSDRSSHIEDDIMQNHEQEKRVNFFEKPRFYEQSNFFLSTLPFSPWVVSAIWLYVGAPHKI